MNSRIILISGPVASGKTTLAQRLSSSFEITLLKTRELLKSAVSRDDQTDRMELQRAGDNLDQETGGIWVRDALARELRDKDTLATVVVDSVRTEGQIDAIRQAYGPIVAHIHIDAPVSVLARRYSKRSELPRNSDAMAYEEVRANATERHVQRLADIADVVVDSERCTAQDVLVRVASHLGLYGTGSSGYVDVIVGGQYGSEGKGQIAAYVSRDYDLLVRVGGPNAGHKVFETPAPYTHHQLPSGTRRSENARLLIGPGAVLNVKKLQEEIAQCGVDVGRLKIDRAAMVISCEDVRTEKKLVEKIGSTGQGVGAATARRILKRFASTKLAKDMPDLEPYLCDALDVLSDAFAENGRICLEGTQGTGLSIYHGHYPYVTSRDTTVAGCISEAGIAPGQVRRVVMVCRTYPIRVQDPSEGTSGPMKQEITLSEIARRSGVALAELEETERTSTTNRERRIAEFDWSMLRRSSMLNRPTDIALTFTDYLRIENRKAKRFDQLDRRTINFIQEVERVSVARVSLIAAGFNSRSIIDRRSW